MKTQSALLTLFLTLTLLGSHTVQVVHDAVHPFHAHLVGEVNAPDSATGHQPHHTPSIEPWLCDLFDAFSHLKAAVNAFLALDFTADLQPGLVAILPILARTSRFEAFQSRAPPVKS